MPRKAKSNGEQNPASESGGTAPEPSVLPPGGERKVAKRSKTASPKRAGRKSTSGSSKGKTTVPTAESSSAGTPQPTDDEIRLRAYFISEHRVRLSLPGSEADDWDEARRQLQEEAGQRSS